MQLLNVLTGSSLDRMPEMTETQTPGRKPKKKKDKESHNAVERHRKKKINSGINRIGNLLPCSQALKQSKNMILDQAFRYITELKKQNDSMLLEGGDKVQAEEICRLRRQLNELRKENDHYIELLKAHDINHKEDPTTHWKGKKRCAKVAKVTPTHQLPKGTVVHCNGSISSTAGKDASPGKQPVSDASVGLRVNGPLLHVSTTLSTPVLLPASAAAPTQSTSGLTVIEQCVIETATTEPTPSSSVSYITLQIPAATTAQLQQSQCATPAPAQTLSIITSASHPTNKSPASTVSTNTMSTQALTRAIRQETTSRNISYAALPNSQAVLRAGAAGSTQTTWTTLPMAGNTLQPVCQSVPTAKITNTPQTVQQVTVCPIGPKPSVCPIQIQMKPPVPTQQAPVGGHVQTQPFQRQCQLHPTVSNQGQPQPQCTVLPQSAVVPQPAVVAHPAVVTQPQAAASLVQHPPTALILQPQPQATVLPLLQTMQVLQVNPAATKTAAVTPPQSTNNPNVVILPCACPTQPVVREEITNQNPCPQIVIIQAPNQAATATQNSQVGIAPLAVPAVSTQLPTASPVTTASLQTVGGKQLVHILPRPAVQPPVSHPQPVTTTSATAAPTPPQMITLNGQVFALHPMKVSEKGSTHTGQSTLQLIQPTTTEEPSTNVALNTLGALSSLNQSISQGSPINITSHSPSQPQPASSVAVQQKHSPTSSSISAATPTPPSQQLQVQCATLAPPVSLSDSSKPPGKRINATSSTKKATAKRTNHGKKKETSQIQNIAGVSLKPREAETLQVTASQTEQALNIKTNNIKAPLTSSTETNTRTRDSTGNVDSSESPQKKTTPSPAHMSSLSLPKSSPSTPQSESPVTPVITTTVTAVSATSVKPQVGASKPTTAMSGNSSTVAKASVQEEREIQATTNSVNSTTQSKLASTSAALTHIKPVVSSAVATETLTTSNIVSVASTTAACIKTTPPASLCQAAKPASPCLLNGSRTRNTPPNKKTEALPTISSVSTVVATPTLMPSAVAASVTSSALRKRHAAQIDDANTANPTSCHHTVEIKPQQPPRTDRAVQEARHSTAAAAPGKDQLLASEAPARKEFALPQQVFTNLDDHSIEHSISSSRQTDSPMAGGGRGFSVASMLPQGHSIGASSGSFGAFTFTSEQADMLALAMLEQDNPGRRSGGCSVNNTSNHSTTTWEPLKTTTVSSSKERTSDGQQAKAEKLMDSGAGKAAVEVSVRRQVGDRHPQSISYSQSQPLPQAQSQSGTGASLSVNNLIRPSSNHQPYPSSPGLAPQQGSAPSPAVTSAHTVQSNNALSPCSRTAQAEYTPLKSALMRAQAERQGKIISKRQAQEEVMLTSGKRPKPCPPSSTTVAHLDVKTQDHSQGMVAQQSSSSIMTRINPEGGGPLFSTNTFINPIARPLDTHCPPQGAHEQNQPGVLHFPQGHPQHPIIQPGQHLGGNIYMKQQQQHQQQQHEQQPHHLYHLQQHLMQPDSAQRLSLHQRALQQQQQQQQQREQQQHVQKKRGLIRGGQTGSAASLQQKQHHLEKSGVQQQHSHQQQQTQHQQHLQQQHQQPAQHQQSHPQQHQQQAHQQPPQAQHQQHHQQQLQQQQQQQQSSHSRHQQHLQQQIQQQQQQHFRHQEKSCEAQAAGSRSHHSGHLTQQDHLKPPQDHNALQRMMSSRSLEQQLISPSNPVSRPSDTSCASSRQERHRVSSYSAEALIGKSSSSSDQQQRMGLHLQSVRGGSLEQPDPRGYMEASRGKANIAQSHNPQTRLPADHQGSTDIQRVTECPPFKGMSGGGEAAQQLSGFELQVSRGSDMAPKSVPPSQRGSQGQQGGFRMGPAADARNRGGYSGAHPSSQAMQVGPVLNRDQEGCHQSFMQSLLSPHLPEPSNHQRSVQCCPPVSIDYSCVSATGDIQAKVSSPSVPPTQKTPTMRLGDGNKGHISQVGANMHAGPGVRAGPPQPPPPHSSSEPGRSSAPSRAPAPVSQHSRPINRDSQPTKLRPGDRQRSGTIRTSNPFEPEGHLPLLTRPQSGGEARRSTIVRFMAETQPPTDNNLVPDQHLPQNFGFPFIPDGGMNPPINANSTFIPPVSQSSSTRTPSLLPVEPQNTLPSFYPSYSPAAHPSLPSDVTLQYFPNQMFTSPSADKASAPPLNNRFGSILSPPRPVGFGQASFPLLPEMPPMPITNSSGITPHISNFSLTSLFPEIATGMPGDGSAMPMSPLLSLSNTSSSDSSKQPNRPAHNISHILGHDGSSAV
ncbi:basic helix-loop-helix domain-containing protein USF3 isoform X2 [Gouania willdenowi]|nr:basic helix-loop-helix domain-containing protein USF3 isoform X2 [Gouania willdenowi]